MIFFFNTLGIFLIQLLFADLLSINYIRPDFIAIYIFYITLSRGRFISIIIAFILGLLINLFGVGSFFGLEALALSILAYFFGFLSGKYERIHPYIFHSIWIVIFLFYFFIICYIRFQTVYFSNVYDFSAVWLSSFGYTMIFLLSMQFFYKISDIDYVENK